MYRFVWNVYVQDLPGGVIWRIFERIKMVKWRRLEYLLPRWVACPLEKSAICCRMFRTRLSDSSRIPRKKIQLENWRRLMHVALILHECTTKKFHHACFWFFCVIFEYAPILGMNDLNATYGWIIQTAWLIITWTNGTDNDRRFTWLIYIHSIVIAISLSSNFHRYDACNWLLIRICYPPIDSTAPS